MFFSFLITCTTFILFLKSLSLKQLPPPWDNEMRLLSLWYRKQSSFFSLSRLINCSLSSNFCGCSSRMSSYEKSITAKFEEQYAIIETVGKMSLLELPVLVLECILEKLSPEGLCNMASVCTSLRELCHSDHLWEKHIKSKWGRLIGPAAQREWQRFNTSRNYSDSLQQGKRKGLMQILSLLWPFNRVSSKVDDSRKLMTFLPADSVMSWYLSLESGKFCFPAQVYNRENGHVSFMLSCYDAELSYDSKTDTFQARYPAHGKRAIAIENEVSWERLRAPPIDRPPHDLHISECLNELRPGDHIELQWRRNKEFPYGWWYGIVGHLDFCDGNKFYCCCHINEMVALEFIQYSPGSRWRQAMINRKDHREKGNDSDGFYGGIRKLYNNEEITLWKRLLAERSLRIASLS